MTTNLKTSAPPAPFVPYKPRPSIILTQLACGPRATAEAERLAELLSGKTYMRFEIIAAPAGGMLIVSVQGDAESVEDLQGMVNMVLTEELLRATRP